MTTFAIRFIVIMFLFHFDVDLVVGHREGYPMSFFSLLLNPMEMIIFAYKNKTDKSNGQDYSQGYHNKDNVKKRR